MRKSRLLPLDSVVHKVLKDTQGEPTRRRPSFATKVFAAFEALGPPLSDHAEATFFRAGILTVTVDDSTWLTELTFLAPEVIETLNTNLGKTTVTQIRPRLGTLTPRYVAPPKPKLHQPPPLTHDEAKRLQAIGTHVKSPALREAMLRAARWSLSK